MVFSSQQWPQWQQCCATIVCAWIGQSWYRHCSGHFLQTFSPPGVAWLSGIMQVNCFAQRNKFLINDAVRVEGHQHDRDGPPDLPHFLGMWRGQVSALRGQLFGFWLLTIKTDSVFCYDSWEEAEPFLLCPSSSWHTNTCSCYCLLVSSWDRNVVEMCYKFVFPEDLLTYYVLDILPACSLSNDSLSVLGDEFVNFPHVLPVQPLEGWLNAKNFWLKFPQVLIEKTNWKSVFSSWHCHQKLFWAFRVFLMQFSWVETKLVPPKWSLGRCEL